MEQRNLKLVSHLRKLSQECSERQALYPVKIMKNWCSICRLYDSMDLVLINRIRCQECDKSTKDMFLTEINSALFFTNNFQFYCWHFLLWYNKDGWSHIWHSMTSLGLSCEPNYFRPWGLGLLYFYCLLRMSKENEFCMTKSKKIRHKQKEPHWGRILDILLISFKISCSRRSDRFAELH